MIMIEIKGLKIQLGKHYTECTKEELSVLPPKNWKSDNDKARFLWIDENGEPYWEFDLDS